MSHDEIVRAGERVLAGTVVLRGVRVVVHGLRIRATRDVDLTVGLVYAEGEDRFKLVSAQDKGLRIAAVNGHLDGPTDGPAVVVDVEIVAAVLKAVEGNLVAGIVIVGRVVVDEPVEAHEVTGQSESDDIAREGVE